MNSDLYYIYKLINGDYMRETLNIIKQMSKKEKKDTCRDQSTYGPVEGCDVAGMSISDCLKCPLNSIEHDHSHILRPIWHDNMIEIGYLKR